MGKVPLKLLPLNGCIYVSMKNNNKQKKKKGMERDGTANAGEGSKTNYVDKADKPCMHKSRDNVWNLMYKKHKMNRKVGDKKKKS